MTHIVLHVACTKKKKKTKKKRKNCKSNLSIPCGGAIWTPMTNSYTLVRGLWLRSSSQRSAFFAELTPTQPYPSRKYLRSWYIVPCPLYLCLPGEKSLSQRPTSRSIAEPIPGLLSANRFSPSRFFITDFLSLGSGFYFHLSSDPVA